jgi:MFS family permease
MQRVAARIRSVRSTAAGLPARRAQLASLGLAFAAMVASGPGQSYLVAVFVDEMLAGTGLSRTVFSALYAGGTVVSAVCMLRLGRLADRVGLRALWVVASLGLAGACALASAAHGVVLAFLGLAFLRTFGQGSFPLLATVLVSRTFAGRRGQAMAVASLGLTATSVLLPPLAVWLILELGWRNAYRSLGLALLVLALPLAVFVRTPASPAGRRPPASSGRWQRGLYPRALRPSRLLPRLEVPSPRALRLLFIVAAPPLIVTAVIFHLVSLLSGRGLSFAQAGLALSVFGVSSAIGTVIGGSITDRARTRTLLAATSGLIALGTGLLLVPTGPVGFGAVVLMGLGTGLFGVAARIVWPRTYGLAEIGRLQGTATSVQIAAAAAGPLPLAVSDAATGGYTAGLLALTVYSACVLAASLRWRDPRIVRVRPVPP